MAVRAPAKINLFLHVGEKRPDGFHALQSLVVFAALGDDLAFSTARELSLAVEGPFAAGLDAEPDNLVLRAARALAAATARADGAAIVLTKNVPVSSGIGGGSADAAATLRGLSKLWSLEVGERRLRDIAETLGSDVPVCLASANAWMEGRGEVVTPAGDIPALAAVLANPRVPVPTGKVFAALERRRGVDGPKPSHWRSAADLVQFLKTTANDLEAPARAIAPEISDVLTALSACPSSLLARMSGSGATCFGIFAEDGDAAEAAQRLKAAHPSWWIAATRLGGSDTGQ